MNHLDVIKIISANPEQFGEVYDRLIEVETACELIINSGSDNLKENIEMMKTSLINFHSSKCELIDLYLESVTD